jgi:hypothetical protein
MGILRKEDYISRGWDFLSLKIQRQLNWHPFALSGSFKLKYFLHDGLLQGKMEEPLPWEGVTQSHPRDHYDGIEIKINPSIKLDFGPIKGTGAQLKFNTGLARPFENLTSQLDLTTVWWSLPLTLWGRTGYHSDLADYYERSSSFGVAFELKSLVE